MSEMEQEIDRVLERLRIQAMERGMPFNDFVVAALKSITFLSLINGFNERLARISGSIDHDPR